MGTWAEVVEAIVGFIILLGSLYALFSLFCVMKFFGRPKYSQAGPPFYPPVSVLKPMKGIDPEWRDNIASFVAQDYPEYEVLLGFNDPRDEGIDLATDIAKSYAPKVRVVVHASHLGSNPKVSNLYGLIEEARYPLLLISDSDIRVGPDYLKEIVGEYLATEKVGIVTCLSRITHASTVGAALECLTTAADFIPSVLTAERLEGVTFGLGPSMMLSKHTLGKIGGLPAFADYLAEDYQIGNCLWKQGYRNILSTYLIDYVVGRMRIREYVVHQLRWARTYKACRPIGFFGYGITHIFPFSLLFLALHGATALSLSILAVILALRYSLLLVVSRVAACPKQWLRWLWLLPAKDILSFGIWLWCFLGSRIFWRGTHYKLRRGGLMRKM
ncbi:MAG: bacteriohopanetetrol glucosamine biosynthesis glycosyltransferase HpnI [Syntrophorhabdales bacterium]|jgi:ceramide glucosyltransferase